MDNPSQNIIDIAPYLDLRLDGEYSELETNGYDFIMADPAWQFANWSKSKVSKNADIHYSCMTLDDIKKIPVSQFAAKNCLLWLWVTNPMLPQGLDVMSDWGFTYKTHGSWQKRTVHGKQSFGTGYVLRSSHETFLIGTRGKPKTTKSVRSSFDGLIREHSRKPEIAYVQAEKLMPDANRLDLFSRQQRKGWTSFGNEISKFKPVEGINLEKPL